MDSHTNAVRVYFKKLGFESEIADIYLALYTHGPQTISALARNARVERTKIYRLIDTLMESNLIEVETAHKRGIMRAAPISNIRILIAQREHDLRSLQDDLELLEQTLTRNTLSDPTTRVQFYHGPEGYKQMLWNETRATTEVLAITRTIMQPHTGRQFYERFANTCNANGVRFRDRCV